MKRGRKAALTFHQQLAVGGFCEDEWRKISLLQAELRHEAKPHMNAVMDLQRKNRQRRAAPRFKFERQFLDEALARARAGRAVTLALKRPYGGASAVLGMACRWCWQKYRRKITPQYARNCWDEFRACEAALLRASTMLS